MNIGSLIIPAVMAAILLYGLAQRVDIFDCFIEGAREGLGTAVSILPSLIALMTCVGIFKASGVLDVLTHALSPVADVLHMPKEIIPLAILRPISGSGAMVIFNNILQQYGPDSYIGRVASVLEGSSETTFYTIAVYYGAIKLSRTRHTLAASLTADLTGFVMSALMVTLFFGAGR
ncbi:spore maturation protein [Ruminococcaceae bacterium OttesenSCG-928-L11]|nr:spore maturation protein [Ruminococcaceae bacterium OttesenSCG-928-L11]